MKKIYESLTICIPVYNEEDRISKLLLSLANIKLSVPYYILVVDDGSTDSTERLLKKYSEKFKNLSYIRHSVNQGRPHARNTLLENTDTKWLTWLDADDEIHPEKLHIQLEYLESSVKPELRDSTLITCNYLWRSKVKSLSPVCRLIEPDVECDQLKCFLDGSNGAYLWLLLGRTKAWKSAEGFDIELPRLQDLDFLISLSSRNILFSKPLTRIPLITYNKDYEGRRSLDVEKSWQRISKKHKKIYLRYGQDFYYCCKVMHYNNTSTYYRRNGDYFSFVKFKICAYFYVMKSPTALKERLINILYLFRQIIKK